MTTAILGLGGGLFLVALMPSFLPMTAVIPVHGVVQLASNASRLAFGWRSLVFRVALPFLAGSVLGAAVGTRFVLRVPTEHMPIVLGAFVLLVTWLPRAYLPRRLPGGFAALGALQTFLSLFVGATGPLSSALLSREDLSRDQTVVTHAAMMTSLHALKCLTFVAVGFAFAPYVPLLIGMVISVSLGSWAGTRCRHLLPENAFKWIFKGILTVLALRLIFF